MALTKIQLRNVTIFEKLDIEFSSGINVLIGENGLGKTHLMKLLYSACQAVKEDVSFPDKVVRVFRPTPYSIHRLVNRSSTSGTAQIKVFSEVSSIGMTFTTRTKKAAAKVTKEADWEKQIDMESTFIPAKEILSNSYNLTHAVNKGNVEFDDTYLDTISSAMVDISRGKDSRERKHYLNLLQKINNGKVTVKQERFFLKPGSHARIEFNLVAEGIRKIALLWQLIKNGTLEHGSVLFWDEPEANINPKHIPMIADLLLMLQRDGVQVFIATHDYFLAKYLTVKATENDKIKYYSLYKNEDSDSIEYDTASKFVELQHNSIMETFMLLYQDEVRKALE